MLKREVEQPHRVSPMFPLATILFLIFLVLKLTGHIDWAWVWVFAPLWIMLGLGLVVFGAILLALRVSSRSS